VCTVNPFSVRTSYLQQKPNSRSINFIVLLKRLSWTQFRHKRQVKSYNFISISVYHHTSYHKLKKKNWRRSNRNGHKSASVHTQLRSMTFGFLAPATIQPETSIDYETCCKARRRSIHCQETGHFTGNSCLLCVLEVVAFAMNWSLVQRSPARVHVSNCAWFRDLSNKQAFGAI
jgi:hypothetical protein